MGTATAKKWWKNSIVYQIYPHSFCENDEGIITISKIISKLHYLKDLGVDIICLSPDYSVFNSAEFGINPQYGTIEDLEKLVCRAKRHGMKIIMSLSDESSFLYLFGKGQVPALYNKATASDSVLEALSFWRGKGIAGVCCDEKLFSDETKGEWDIFTFPKKLEEKKGMFSIFNKRSKSKRLIQSVDQIQDTNEQSVLYFDDYKNINQVPNMEKCEKMFCGLHLSLKGMPFIYEGAEKGSILQDENQENDIYTFYKQMIEFRKNSKGLLEGSYRRVAAPSDVYVFTRESKEERLYIYCNFTASNKPVEFYGDKIIFGNYDESDREDYALKPYEFRIVASYI